MSPHGSGIAFFALISIPGGNSRLSQAADPTVDPLRAALGRGWELLVAGTPAACWEMKRMAGSAKPDAGVKPWLNAVGLQNWALVDGGNLWKSGSRFPPSIRCEADRQVPASAGNAGRNGA
jgi:hypothetical protein